MLPTRAVRGALSMTVPIPDLPTQNQQMRALAACSPKGRECLLYENIEDSSCMQTGRDGPGTILPLFLDWTEGIADKSLQMVVLDYIQFEKRFRQGYMLTAPQVYISGSIIRCFISIAGVKLVKVRKDEVDMWSTFFNYTDRCNANEQRGDHRVTFAVAILVLFEDFLESLDVVP
ncbi:hypothetical protein B0H14DRAFT_3142482 [Mycena olivaceomarginata]|nr:hypothetical protein B0H14DRAFT_3142482 [Mycena olivaceomarginata]